MKYIYIMMRLILILTMSIIIGLMFNISNFNQTIIRNSDLMTQDNHFNGSVNEHFDVSKLNTINPPELHQIVDNPKRVISSVDKVCFRKPTLKYHGVWGKDNNEVYCGTSPSFQFNEEIIDGKYITDDGCVGGDQLKLCCDEMVIVNKHRNHRNHRNHRK
jgi:hypothetical protein